MNKQIKGNKTSSKGFTLIELVVVIGILAVLFAIVLIAINPGRQFKQANDAKRQSDVNAILNAVGQYSAENKGDLTGLGTIAACPAVTSINNTNAATLCTKLVTDYIAALPTDPGTGNSFTSCAAFTTGYNICKSATNARVTVSAPNAENGTISVTR